MEILKRLLTSSDWRLVLLRTAVLIAILAFAIFFFSGSGKEKEYSNPDFHISLRYPSEWDADERYVFNGTTARFSGETGFFQVDAAPDGTLETLVQGLTDHIRTSPDSEPLMEEISLGSVTGHLISFPGDSSAAAAFAAPYPWPVRIGEGNYQFFILYADAGHIKNIAQSVAFFAGAGKEVRVYFGNENLDPEATCTKVFPLHRIVEDTPAISRSALEALLGGPTLHERSLGYGTSINSGVVVQSISVQDGVARVDFDRAIERSVGGSCRVAAIRAQIAETLKQFPEISSVVISVEGETEAALQP